MGSHHPPLSAPSPRPVGAAAFPEELDDETADLIHDGTTDLATSRTASQMAAASGRDEPGSIKRTIILGALVCALCLNAALLIVILRRPAASSVAVTPLEPLERPDAAQVSSPALEEMTKDKSGEVLLAERNREAEHLQELQTTLAELQTTLAKNRIDIDALKDKVATCEEQRDKFQEESRICTAETEHSSDLEAQVEQLEAQLKKQAREAWNPWPAMPQAMFVGTWPHGKIKPAELIIVASGKRSGSTSFMLNLTREHPCIYNCGEFFHATVASKTCEAAVPAGLWQNRISRPLEVIQAARSKFCGSEMPKDWNNPKGMADPSTRCAGGCALIIKLFDHQLEGNPLRSLLLHPGTRTVVLERDPAARKCSLNHAEKTGDWAVTPALHSKPLPPCPRLAPSDFVSEHQAFYSQVRSLLFDNHMQRMEVPFESAIHDTSSVLEKVYEFSGLALTRNVQSNESKTVEGAGWAPYVGGVTLFGRPGRPRQMADFIVIASDEHSGSVGVSKELARHHGCIIECGNVFGKDTWCNRGIAESRWQQRWLDTVTVMKQVRAQQCMQLEQCSGLCTLVVELFPTSFEDKSLIEPLLLEPRTSTVVLEADPAQVWCRWHQSETRWWQTCPSRASKEYESIHSSWYKKVRNLLSKNAVQRLEVPFEVALRDTPAVLASIYEFSGLV